jgi:hypothetical protein
LAWVEDEPWPGFDQAAIDAEGCAIDGLIRTPGLQGAIKLDRLSERDTQHTALRVAQPRQLRA